MRYIMLHLYEILLVFIKKMLLRWCHDIGGEHATNKPMIKTVKMIEVSRKSGHATQANGEGGSLA
ncbi:hypothetical protein HanRHA438_Chr01g0013101 [Helianthus annuus]|nr:hypothetical protein HanRHA438_Chr01g0013101 [Helianthus annuus]